MTQTSTREQDRERLRRRAQLLREIAEGRELRGRVTPRRTHLQRLRTMAYMRTFSRPI
ncbi:hypothetical protein EV189_0996 [Motilibacter rhizosphaerae]|uniref:Uncharacterized protein n=1 Tax=Motilibacter rhizosphaerae TaxID=598652 RepID=A0A4V2F566_9ACTN|nr:hypothetical protein [Motilibacter rhizosphaerae]RZS91749.1 hypothetical protein EV189_0996 [Motilibacter rhizosphaerae]